jgi:Domain of unknown function (DUF4214)
MARSLWSKWWKGTKGFRSCRRISRLRPNSKICLERLEDRTVPSTLDISGGSLTYTASAGIVNNLTIGLSTGNYSFTDTGETITLTPGALAAGWTGSGTNTVVGPAASVTTNFTVNLLDGDDALEVDGAISVAGVISLQSGQDLTLNASIATTANGNITLQADNPAINQVINPGTGTVLLEPQTQSLKITVGTASVLGYSFGLTNADLGWITSGVTQLGVAADTGDITVTATIDATPTGTAPSRSQTLALFTSAIIGDNGGFGRLIVQNLDVGASGSGPSGTFTPTVSLTNTKNAIGSLSGDSHFFESFVQVVDHVPLDVGSFTGLDDLVLTAPSLNLTVDLNITGIQTYVGPVTLGADITLTGIGVTFKNTVESPGTAHALTLHASTQFGGPVGGDGNPLASLTMDGAGFTGQPVTTIGTQAYGGIGVSNAPTTLTSITNQPISIGANGVTLSATSLVLATTASTTLPSQSTFDVSLANSSTSALVNSSGGGIDLNGAKLLVFATNAIVGQTYTIVSSPLGVITGTFAGLPDRAIYSPNSALAFRIHYTATAVTLTDTLLAPTITTADNTTFALEGGIFSIQATGLPSPTITESGFLPGGVAFTRNGASAQLFLSHTAASYGVFPITITASNGVAPNAVQHFTLTISGIPSYAFTPNQRFVAQVYLDLFHQVVDQAGLTYWTSFVDQGVARSTVVFRIERSSSNQFQSIEVQQIYSLFLHRSAEPAALNFGVNFLNSGGTVQQLSAILIGSPEYYLTQGGGTNQGFVEAMYQDALQRPIDPDALAYDVNFLAQGGSRSSLALSVTTSVEADQLFVENAYETYLGRRADPGGLAYYTQSLQTGSICEQVIAALMGSPEFFQNRITGT